MTMAQSILDLISERQTVVAATITDLREHIGKLTDELRTAEIEFNDLATTRTTLNRLTATSNGLSGTEASGVSSGRFRSGPAWPSRKVINSAIRSVACRSLVALTRL
jgi:hypothetical protein